MHWALTTGDHVPNRTTAVNTATTAKMAGLDLFVIDIFALDFAKGSFHNSKIRNNHTSSTLIYTLTHWHGNDLFMEPTHLVIHLLWGEFATSEKQA